MDSGEGGEKDAEKDAGEGAVDSRRNWDYDGFICSGALLFLFQKESTKRLFMQYRSARNGDKISMLGFGCMRFSKKGGAIDYEKAEKEVLEAVRLGVNYLDTAYVYPGSEECVGRIVAENGLRDQVYIATKLPQYLVRKAETIDRYFDEELKRLRTDHIDFYLMHMFTDYAEWTKLQQLGIEDWIRRKKESGAIRSIGFSFHGNSEMFLKILAAYDWDFCQIQYNYLDEHSQAGRRGLEAAEARGIPVIIMEPLRGGKLVNLLPAKCREMFRDYGKTHPDRKWSPAEWSFRWLMSQTGVTCVLSGMNSVEMVRENCRVASEVRAGELTEEDLRLIADVIGEINRKMKIGCTGCGYCMPCPKGVDIPGIFRCYNRIYTESRGAGFWEFYQTMALRKDPPFASQCVGCGRCEQHCPQGLPIRKLLKTADRTLRPAPVRAVLAGVRKFMFH